MPGGAGVKDPLPLRSAFFRNISVRAEPPLPAAPDDGAHLGLRAWRSPSGAGSFLHADVAGFRVTAGAPRTASDRLAALFSEFADDCARSGRRRVHFGLPAPLLEFLHGPCASLRIGDLPVFDLGRWLMEATIPAGIRAQIRRARNRGVTVRHVSRTPTDLSPLIACREAWLAAKPLPPLRFMTTPYLFDPWPAEGVLIAEREGRVEGFLSSSRALFGGMLRIDAVGRRPDAVNGVPELLVSECFRRAAERGIERATLGLAPLSRRSGAAGSRVPDFARALAVPFYSFEGLEAFKAKFAPDAWIPMYCAAPGRVFGPRDALAVARAFAGGSVLRYAARTAVWSAGFKKV